ncbi:MAG: anti-sigma factor [Phycisphaerales bacterium]
MSDTAHNNYSERLIDLAIDHATGLLDPSSTQELISTDPSSTARDEYEQAAAAADVAFAYAHPEDLPANLMDSLLDSVASLPPHQESGSSLNFAEASSNPYRETTNQTSHSSSASSRVGWFPWMVAAASIMLTTIVILTPTKSTLAPQSIQDQRLALIESTPASELTVFDWIATDDPAFVGNQGDVIGDVVWSDTLNEGYMRINGLAINDASVEQYQLWIFDADRPTGDLPQFGEGLLTQRPVDGGVFDITQEGDVIVKINAKLNVTSAAVFAITVEPPGGVVVSDRSRVPLLGMAP